MGTKRRVMISYSCVQASFWMNLCVFMGFAAVYLQSLGYSNARIGVIMACGTLGGSLLGPELSSLIDRSTADRITAQSMTPPVLAAEAVAIVVLLLFPVKGLVTSVAFVLFIALSTSVNSLNLKLYTDAGYLGLDIDYGIARSMGSLGYVVTSGVVGALCESISARVVPAAGLILCACQFLTFLDFSRFLKAAEKVLPGDGAEDAELADGTEDAGRIESAGLAEAESAGGGSIIAFLVRNKRFSMVLIGTLLVFFAHSTMCNFFINIVRNVGGDIGVMGFLNGFMALVEIPVIFFFSRIARKFRTESLLRAGFVIFTAKAAGIAAAGSVAGIAAALLLQAPSFGLYTAAIVPYVDMVIPHDDSAKAQSLAFSVTMLSSVFASAISGRMFDVLPVSSVMWIVCAVSAVGSIVAYFGVQRHKYIKAE